MQRELQILMFQRDRHSHVSTQGLPPAAPAATGAGRGIRWYDVRSMLSRGLNDKIRLRSSNMTFWYWSGGLEQSKCRRVGRRLARCDRNAAWQIILWINIGSVRRQCVCQAENKCIGPKLAKKELWAIPWPKGIKARQHSSRTHGSFVLVVATIRVVQSRESHCAGPLLREKLNGKQEQAKMT